jgi:hypothetical protein
MWVWGSAHGQTDVYEVQAYDGNIWSATGTVTAATPNTAPVVQAPARVVDLGETAAASSLFSAADPDGDAVTRYRFEDQGTGGSSGHFTVGGVVQAAGAVFEVAASALSTVAYVGGSAAGIETLRAGAYDGMAWSVWQPFDVTTQVNQAPVVGSASVTLGRGEWRSIGLSASDPDGDTITLFRVRDTNTDGDSGHFWAGSLGNVPATDGGWHEITPQDFQDMWVWGSAHGQTDVYEVQAYDGSLWGATGTVTAATPNTAPVLTVLQASSTVVIDEVVLFDWAGDGDDLLSYVDAEGDAIAGYRVVDQGTGAGSGYFTVGGVVQGAGSAFEFSDLSSLAYHGGSVAGTETVLVEISDGLSWSNQVSLTVTTQVNQAPVVGSVSVDLGRGEWRSIGLSASDPDGDAITLFRVRDTNTDAGSGQFWAPTLGYVPASDGGWQQITPRDFQDLWVRGSGHGQTDVYEIQAYDGNIWSATGTVTVATPNAAPVVQALNRVVDIGETAAASSLLNAADPDGDAITRYRFEDQGTGGGSGHFTVAGVVQAAGAVFEVAASALSTVAYVGGSAAGIETLRAGAYDGMAWSVWQPFDVTTQVNQAPVVGSASVTLARGEWCNISLSASDPDGDTITKFRVRDTNTDPNSGHFWSSSVGDIPASDNGWYEITPVGFQNLWVNGGLQVQTDVYEVQAYDGSVWGASGTITAATANAAPVVQAPNLSLDAGQSVLASSLFSAADPDGDAVTRYRFEDQGTGSGSGHFTVAGVVQAAGAVFEVAASALSTVAYVAGSATGTETLRAGAYDGLQWSAWQAFEVTTQVNQAPAVGSASVTLGRGEWRSIALSASDPDGDAITKFRVRDTNTDPNSGHFWSSSVGDIPASDNGWYEITPVGFQNLWVNGGLQVQTDVYEVQAYDGSVWGASGTITAATANAAPVVQAPNLSLDAGQSVLASSLFSAADPDGDAVTRYRFEDQGTGSGSGHFTVAGVVQAAGAVFEVAASALSTVAYVAGSATGTETLRAGAYDGALWSAWQPFDVTTQVNQAPVVGSASVTLARGEWRNISLSASDPDGDTITIFRVRDTNTDPNSGHFWSSSVGDIPASDNGWYEITPVGFQNLWVNGGLQVQTDVYEVQAYDGQVWSAAATITATVPGDNPAPENPAQDIDNVDSDNVDSVEAALAGPTVLAAGAGDDLFVFADGAGDASISNFAPGPDGGDRIDLSDFAIDSFDALLATARDDGAAGVVLALDEDDSLTLIGVRLGDLDPDDFILG